MADSNVPIAMVDFITLPVYSVQALLLYTQLDQLVDMISAAISAAISENNALM